MKSSMSSPKAHKMKPSANFTLNDELAKHIKGKEIGERYTVVVEGTVTNLSKSKDYNSMGMDIDLIHCDGGIRDDMRKMKKANMKRGGYAASDQDEDE